MDADPTSLAAGDAEKLDLSVDVADAGPCRKKISIEVPAETVDQKLAESLDILVGEAELPGFRKGRAPKRLVQKRFGDTVQREAKRAVVAQAFRQAVEERELKVIGDPTGGTIDEAVFEAGKPLQFELEVEVQPEFEMPQIEGLEIKRPILEVTDEMVADEIQKICINEGDLEQREAPEAGDYLSGRGRMMGPGGEEFYNIEGAVVRVPLPEDEGKGMILGVMVADFVDQLGLPKPGEAVTVKTTGPENHEREELRGVELTITFDVSRVDRIIPAKLEDLVTRFGMTEEAQLREALRARLNQQVMVRQQSVLRQQVAKHLLDSTEMELPERLTASQAARNMQRRRLELMHRGVPEQEIENHMAELRSASANTAARDLKLFFILNHAANDLGVTVTEPEVNARIAQMASAQQMRPEELRHRLIESGQIGSVFQQLREHKTMDAILSKATVEDMPADEFNKLMQAEGAEAGAEPAAT